MSPTKKEEDVDLDLNAELERELLSVVEDAPPKRSSIKKEQSPPKASTSSTPNATPGSQSLPKKPMLKREPKPKPKEPAQLFMNPNSAAARVANKKSVVPKQEVKSEQKQPVPSLPTLGSKVAKLAGDLKRKGVKRESEPEVGESARVQKRPRPSPPPSKMQPKPRPQISKLPPLAAGLPPKPQTTMIPPKLQPQPKPQPKPQQPAKKEFNLELPTASSFASSSKNPLLGGGSPPSLSTGPSTPGVAQPSTSTVLDAVPTVLSDSESDWDEVDADGPSPLGHQLQPQSEPQPYRLGSLTIEENPPAGFNGTLDIVEGDDDRYEDRDRDAEGEAEGVDIDVDDLMAEMDEQLESGGGGEQEGEGDVNGLNDMEDFLIDAVSPEPEQDQGGYQDGDVDTYLGDMFGDDDSSSSSDDSDD